ncbi:MAG: hypothetical protein KQJ78_07355 [Deltaproteobacteria bacterium]|nr:hypothetical protein [Deltaproteobacteria bacterium]
MANPFQELLDRHRRGARPAFCSAAFLCIRRMWDEGWRFADILREAPTMAAAARSNLELGFDSTVLPYDLNVEAEILGAPVNYHPEVEGVPVYPTVGNRPVARPEDVVIPADLARQGRLPQILDALARVKAAAGRAAVGAFLPGPFTLAGQVMDLDQMFVMTLKDPAAVTGILARLTRLLAELRSLYEAAGADYVMVEEGGATAISPRLFRKLVLEHLQELLAGRRVPHMLSITGNTDKFLELMLECGPDALGVDQAADLAKVRAAVPPDLPLAAVAGSYTMLSEATPDEVRQAVRQAREAGVDVVLPPSDIYPPAKMENIAAFLEAVRA